MKGHPHLTYLLNWFAHLPWQTQVKVVGVLGWLIRGAEAMASSSLLTIFLVAPH